MFSSSAKSEAVSSWLFSLHTMSKQLPYLAAPFKIPSLACFIARQTVLFSAAVHTMMCPKLMPSPASAKLYPSSCSDIPAVFSSRLSSCRVFQLAYLCCSYIPESVAQQYYRHGLFCASQPLPVLLFAIIGRPQCQRSCSACSNR
jgi:hypothetical protein